MVLPNDEVTEVLLTYLFLVTVDKIRGELTMYLMEVIYGSTSDLAQFLCHASHRTLLSSVGGIMEAGVAVVTATSGGRIILLKKHQGDI